ncbi:unnamed protein product [Pieris brassicae]|uniref:Uncharacterized protein n=1 Tax=Pieris brassicae TaxID=7116 RepID=A0A9P0SHH4_PIEBR|nr:unnamed protein product [Pieris brassicae]
MIAKVLCITTLLAVVTAQYGHGHSDAHSSQHFVKHDGHPEVVHGHHGHHDYHISRGRKIWDSSHRSPSS